MYPTFAFTYVLGVIFLILGIAIFLNKKSMVLALEEIAKNKGLLFLYGFVALITGLVFISLSHVGLIVLIGWLGIIKGAFILICPEAAASLYKKAAKPSIFAFVGVIAILLGLIFLL